MESLGVTIKEMEREIRRDEGRGREFVGVKTGDKEGGKRLGAQCPVPSCNQNAFPRKHVAEKEDLSHSIEHIHSSDRCPPTVKQAPQLQ